MARELILQAIVSELDAQYCLMIVAFRHTCLILVNVSCYRAIVGVEYEQL